MVLSGDGAIGEPRPTLGPRGGLGGGLLTEPISTDIDRLDTRDGRMDPLLSWNDSRGVTSMNGSFEMEDKIDPGPMGTSGCIRKRLRAGNARYVGSRAGLGIMGESKDWSLGGGRSPIGWDGDSGTVASVMGGVVADNRLMCVVRLSTEAWLSMPSMSREFIERVGEAGGL
jgi:hypothetical protein